MTDLSNAVAFFDIGNTLASVRVSAAGNSIEELIVFPDVPPVLEELRAKGVSLGILSNRVEIPEENVNKALKRAGLLPFFDRNLILYGPKDSSRLFEQAQARVLQSVESVNGERPLVLFVGEDSTERAQARAVDFLVAPHPRLALTILMQQGPLRYLRIRVPAQTAATDWRGRLRELAVVPLHLSSEPGDAVPVLNLYAIADAPTAAKLDDLGFWVDRLGADDEPLTTDLYILRDDRQAESGFLVADGNSFDFFRGPRSARRVLSSTHEGLFVSVPAGRSVESYHFAAARHGHNLKLVASMSMLESTELDANERLAGTVRAAEALLSAEAAPSAALPDTTLVPLLSTAQKKVLKQKITTKAVGRDVERYTGVKPVAGTKKIVSRHIHHPHNAEAVLALTKDLKQLGGSRLTVRTHQFTHEGNAYDNVEAILPASGLKGIVMVTAHMDSTGARKPGYVASSDAAPGADDDASGIAGVLSAARAILALATAGIKRREVRFLLFNAEEHGLIGSRAYASEQAQLAAKIVAVFQLDMIGYDVKAGRTFELHAGFTPTPAVQSRSLKLAQLIAALISEISPTLPAPQLYPGGAGQSDPAENRSDHSSFQLEGYAACLASEDFFAGPGTAAPAPDPNPNYHLPADNAVNARYAADIARAIAAAAWIASTR
jgi:bacterial leucyl aminopeptidase